MSMRFRIERVLWTLGVVGLVLSGNLACGAGCNGRSETPEVQTRLMAPVSNSSSEEPSSDEIRMSWVPVGRAVEMRDLERAHQLLRDVTEGSADLFETRFLQATVAEKRQDWEQVVLSLEGLVYPFAELRRRGEKQLLAALLGLDRHAEVIERSDAFLSAMDETAGAHRRELLSMKTRALRSLGRLDEAITVTEELIRLSRRAQAQEHTVQLARLRLEAKNPEEARALLAPLALTAERPSVMRDAYRLLEQEGWLPRWTFAQELERIETLMSRRQWDTAQAAIARLQKEASAANAKELRWRMANLLFQRRRHYREAVTALDQVIQDGSPYADSAEFLRARALSRLDRDVEAIEAFHAYARRTRRPARAQEARFFASRLEYYLGRHENALENLRQLVGSGTQARRTSLSADAVRDAHFLAGMSAFLLQRYDIAASHMEAASKGTTHREVITRNQYWRAVSVLGRQPQRGAEMLQEICAADETSWYALFAGIRLEQAGQNVGRCLLLPASCDKDPCESMTLKAETTVEAPATDLAEVSPLADLYARMGLFKDAARVLSEAEKQNASSLSDREWVLHYNLLDAPQYAIRRASNRLNWQQRERDLWRARAAYPVPYVALVTEREVFHGLPGFLVYSIARQESLFDPYALSSVGAMGMMQMMPATWETNRKRAGLPKLEQGRFPNPAESVIAGSQELAHLLERFHGVLPLAIMAYNGGSAAVDRWVERSGSFPMDVFVEKAGFTQTRNYVRRVYSTLFRYRQLYGAPLPHLPRDLSAHLQGISQTVTQYPSQ